MGILLVILSLAFIAGSIVGLQQSRSAFRRVAASASLFAAMFFGFLAFLAFKIAHSHPEYGTGLATVTWLDSRASDISYYRANDFGGNFAYEFRTSSNDFAAIAKEHNWLMAPMTEHHSIWRYSFFLSETDSLRHLPLSVDLDNGLFYENRRPNGGGVTVLYDASTSKAYVVQSSR